MIYIVACEPGCWILGAYPNRYMAEAHARTVTGAHVVTVQVLFELPEHVVDLLESDYYGQVTPPINEVPHG